MGGDDLVLGGGSGAVSVAGGGRVWGITSI